MQFLTDLFDELNRRPAPGDLEAASAYFTALSWAGAELLSLAEGTDQALYQRYELAVLDAISASPRDFVPPRSMDLASDLAHKHGRPDPSRGDP